jgi:glutamine synthetase
MMSLFEKKHSLHIELYGADNDKRLTGIHETSSVTKFSFGCGNRSCSFRIPTQTMHDDGKGYVEDRRPASNIDPYTVSAMVYDTGCNLGKADDLVNHYKAWTKWLSTAIIEHP